MKNKQKEVIFFSLGGTWNAHLKSGKIVGIDFLGDDAFYALEKKLGYFKKNADYSNIEWKLAQYLDKEISKRLTIKGNVSDSLKFVKNISDLIHGESILFYDFPSDYIRTSVIAPTVVAMLKYASTHQTMPILAGIGTDTADIALIPLLEAYTFDTDLPPFLFTGSNRASFQKDSDAPKNFYDLAKAATINLSPGAYWVFSGMLFSGSDFIKLSPYEMRLIDNLYTFYSPHLKSQKIDDLLKDKKDIKRKIVTKENHISKITTTKSLFDAITKVHIVDIGEQNELQEDIKTILDSKYKAVIVAGNSQGSVPNPIQYACIEAALNNKIVIVASRCFSGDVVEFYSYCVLAANSTVLRSKGKKIVSARKLNKNVARALAIRAVEEGLNQKETDDLFAHYTLLRELSEHDTVTIYE